MSTLKEFTEADREDTIRYIQLRLSGRIAKLKQLKGYKDVDSQKCRIFQRGYIEALTDLASARGVLERVNWREDEW